MPQVEAESDHDIDDNRQNTQLKINEEEETDRAMPVSTQEVGESITEQVTGSSREGGQEDTGVGEDDDISTIPFLLCLSQPPSENRKSESSEKPAPTVRQ